MSCLRSTAMIHSADSYVCMYVLHAYIARLYKLAYRRSVADLIYISLALKLCTIDSFFISVKALFFSSIKNSVFRFFLFYPINPFLISSICYPFTNLKSCLFLSTRSLYPRKYFLSLLQYKSPLSFPKPVFLSKSIYPFLSLLDFNSRLSIWIRYILSKPITRLPMSIIFYMFGNLKSCLYFSVPIFLSF